MKYLITGSCGQLGTELKKQLSEAQIDFVAADINAGQRVLNIADLQAVREAVLAEKPDVYRLTNKN